MSASAGCAVFARIPLDAHVAELPLSRLVKDETLGPWLEPQPGVPGESGELAPDDGQRGFTAAPDQHRTVVLPLDGGERRRGGLPEPSGADREFRRRPRASGIPRRRHLAGEEQVGHPPRERPRIGARGVAEHEDRERLLGEAERVGAEADEAAPVGHRGESPVLAEPQAARVVLRRPVVEAPRGGQPPQQVRAEGRRIEEHAFPVPEFVHRRVEPAVTDHLEGGHVLLESASLLFRTRPVPGGPSGNDLPVPVVEMAARHAHRPEEMLAGELPQRQPGNPGNQLREEPVARVGVEVFGARVEVQPLELAERREHVGVGVVGVVARDPGGT